LKKGCLRLKKYAKLIPMGWEELIDSLDELETKRDYDGYFCSVKNAVIILILGSLCDLKNIKRIHEWASTAQVQEYLKKEFNIQRIPCYWWLLSLLSLITPESLNKCEEICDFNVEIESLKQAVQSKLLLPKRYESFHYWFDEKEFL